MGGVSGSSQCLPARMEATTQQGDALVDFSLWRECMLAVPACMHAQIFDFAHAHAMEALLEQDQSNTNGEIEHQR